MTDSEEVKKLNSSEAYTVLKAYKTQDDLKLLYGKAMRFGTQNLNTERVDWILKLITFEIQERQANESFMVMKRLTWISIGLAVFQVVLAIVVPLLSGKS